MTGPIRSGLDIKTFPNKDGNLEDGNFGGLTGTPPNIGSINKEGGLKDFHFY